MYTSFPPPSHLKTVGSNFVLMAAVSPWLWVVAALCLCCRKRHSEFNTFQITVLEIICFWKVHFYFQISILNRQTGSGVVSIYACIIRHAHHFATKKICMCKENGNKIRQLQIKETQFILPYLIEFIKSSNFYLLLCYSFRFVVHAYEALAKTQYFLPCCVHFHCNSVHICNLCKCISKNVPVVHLFKHILS